MPISPARQAAFDILLRVEREDSYASELLHSRRCAQLSSADHGLATELVMGVLRWRSLLDKEIAERSSQPLSRLDPQVLAALRIGAYQLQFLDRVPEHAAVHESVELVKQARKRSAAPFANAVMRKLAETAKRDPVSAIVEAETPAELSETSSHPRWLVERWSEHFGFDVARKICRRNQQAPETAIRVSATAEAALPEQKIDLAPGQLLASARRVTAGDVTQTGPFREGAIAIQDEASQLIALLVGTGSRILDCCAAPGGKTQTIAQRNPRAVVVASDLHPHRAALLGIRIAATNVRVLTADACYLPTSALFDRVLADVPCSGTGTLGRNPEIKWRLGPEELGHLQTRQLAILQSVMQRVARGGRLVYSTCSLEPEENAQIVKQALAADTSFRTLDCRGEIERLRAQGELVWPDLDSLVSGRYLRTIPGIHPCDGFFAAILEKI